MIIQSKNSRNKQQKAKPKKALHIELSFRQLDVSFSQVKHFAAYSHSTPLLNLNVQ